MERRHLVLLDKIKSAAVETDWKLAFGGKSYGNRHLFRVNRIISFLNSREGGDPFISQAAGWVHDVALAYGNDDNPDFIASKTELFLARFRALSKFERDLIIKAVKDHETGGSETTLESRIVYDADVLDKGGILGVIRHIWKMTNLIEGRLLGGEDDLQKLKANLDSRASLLFTQTANSIMGKLNQYQRSFFVDKDLALHYLAGISAAARAGEISDNIATSLSANDRSAKWLEAVDLQLNCKYLDNN